MAGELFFNRINRLPDFLVNRIAAGEVIERPASVVKELIENSLDAGASKITVQIKRGGKQFIRVTDNGQGIHADDLQLAIDRHTTSKLNQDSDLSRIATLGFRGEALSSIAAISRLRLTSRYSGSDYAWTLVTDQNDSRLGPDAHPPGTSIQVEDLFYNTPARRKFLRSEKTEFIHIQELVKRIVLSRFQLAIELIHNDRKILQVSDDSSDPARRLQVAFGKKFVRSSVAFQETAQNMEIHGWAGLPEVSRSQSDQQFFFLNGRIIRDKLVNNAIRLAYQQCLHPGRHPVYLVFLEMDLSGCDVNVHPCKHEVRFRDARTVHDFIFGSLSSVLTANIRDVKTPEYNPADPVNVARDHTYSTVRSRIGERGMEYRGHLQLHPLLQGKFVLIDEDDRITLLDTCRAREIIVHRYLLEAYEKGNVMARPVLVPLYYKCNGDEFMFFEQKKNELQQLGVETLAISPTEIQIRSIPQVLAYADVLSLITDILDRFQNGNRKITDWIKVFSHHASDLVPNRPTQNEIQLLIDEYRNISVSLTEKERQGIMTTLDQDQLRTLLGHG